MMTAVRDRWRARSDRVRGREVDALQRQTGEAFDPPPYGLARTARRLGDVWQEQRHLSIVGLVYAFFYCVLSLAIPLLIATAIDSSIVEHTYPLAPLLVAIGALSVIRAWVNVQRRYATSRVGINIEARLRELSVRGVFTVPAGFF